MTVRLSTASFVLVGATTCLLVINSNFFLDLNRVQFSNVVEGLPPPPSKEQPAFHTTATKCSATIDPQADSKSQHGEDKHLLRWYNGICNGTYVEMGALNGIRFSNSYIFHQPPLHWRGLLVEVSPSSHQQLLQNRPGELVTPVHAAVCADRRTVHYYTPPRTPAVAGVWEFSSQEHRDMWWKGVTIDQATPIECTPMQDILDKYLPDHRFFDFCKLAVSVRVCIEMYI